MADQWYEGVYVNGSDQRPIEWVEIELMPLNAAEITAELRAIRQILEELRDLKVLPAQLRDVQLSVNGNGTEDHPGLLLRMDRVEGSIVRQRAYFKAVWASLGAIGIAVLSWVLGWFRHS
jgi:hypothetical protein